MESTEFANESQLTFENTSDSDYNYTYIYCSANYAIFWQQFDNLVFNLNLILCILGVLFNIVNLSVFSRREMMNPTNLILAAISFSDMLVMAAYIPEYFAKFQYVKQHSPYSAAVIWIIHEYFLSVFHPMSIWLNTTLALFRYVAVIHIMKSRFLCTMTRSKVIIFFILIFNILICIPGYLAVSIVESDPTKTWRDGGCASPVCAKWTSFNFLRKIEFLYQGLFSKVIPSLILTFVSIRLIFALLKAHNERKKLVNGEGVIDPDPEKAGQKEGAVAESKRDFDRTTKMLLVVLILFLLTELPPGLVHILEVLYGPIYYFECRRPVHYLVLTMYFLSGVLNFPVYVLMSKNYRNCLGKILNIRRLQAKGSKNQGPSQSSSMGSSALSVKTQDSVL